VGPDPDGDDPERTLLPGEGAAAGEGGRTTSPGAMVGGRYRLQRPVGRGASGTVWRAHDTAADRTVAVKLIPTHTASEAGRARREAAALRLVQLEGIARLTDDFVEGGAHVLVMEFVDGTAFPGADRLAWDELAARAKQLLAAVGRLHRLGVVHRDLKPAYVLVGTDGRVTVVDLGIARGAALGPTLTNVGGILGTPRYLSPEQARGERGDERSDLYGIGVILYEALTGSPPVEEDEALLAYLTRKQAQDAPSLTGRVPGIPAPVARMIHALLQRAPAARPRSAEEALAALGPGAGPELFPWLGPRDPVERVVERARAGRSTWVGGPPGTGRSRVVQEALAELRAEGREVASTVPGGRPLESLTGAIGPPRDGPGALAEAEDALRGALARGLVLDLGDVDALDRWTAGRGRWRSGCGAPGW